MEYSPISVQSEVWRLLVLIVVLWCVQLFRNWGTTFTSIHVVQLHVWHEFTQTIWLFLIRGRIFSFFNVVTGPSQGDYGGGFENFAWLGHKLEDCRALLHQVRLPKMWWCELWHCNYVLVILMSCGQCGGSRAPLLACYTCFFAWKTRSINETVTSFTSILLFCQYYLLTFFLTVYWTWLC